MEKLKIRVNSEAESKEGQELFFKLGCFIDYPKKCLNDAVILFLESCGLLTYSSTETYVTDGVEYKQITLPQLRDMVVLKLNNVNDRNVVDPEYTANLYLDSKGKLFVFHIPTRSWKTSNLNGEEEVMQRLKPIKEKEMKEFLVNHNNKWTLQLLDADAEENSFRVTVPSGADVAILEQGMNKPEFINTSKNKVFNAGNWFSLGDSFNFDDYIRKMIFTDIIWQRHTQPEELPFIDDEPKSLNDTYAEIEKVRQHNHYFKDVSDIEQMDVYEVLKRFEVTDPCLQHIVKKALCAGQRGHKDFKKDLQDILDTAVRAVDINK